MTEISDTVDEALIERYVLNPEGLTGEERAVVEAHLEANPSSKAIADYLRSFYDELEEVTPAASEKIDRLAADPRKGESNR